MSAQHLGLTLRKALAPKLCLLEGMIPLDSKLRGQGLGFPLDDLANSVSEKSLLERVRTRSVDSERLDAFVNTFVERRGREIEGDLPPQHRIAITPLLTRFYENARYISCDECNGGRICCGLPSDSTIVEQDGRCIRQLKVMFDLAVAVAELYYRKYVPNPPNPPITFSTEGALEILHGVSTRSDVVVSGHCKRTGPASRDVTLFLDVDRFNLESYLATLYVLMHECVIHAYEGTAEPARPWDPFAEGWMDFVVELILGQIVSDLGPAASIRGQLPGAMLYRDFASQFSSARADHKKRKDRSTHVRLGRDAANSLLVILASIQPEIQRDALDAFLELSLRVNVQNVTPEYRKAFVMSLGSALGTADAGTVGAEVTRAVCGYFKSRGRKVAELVVDIASHSTP